MEKTIKWNNAGTAGSIQEGIAEMKMGKDIGWQRTINLMPGSDDFHHWMHYNYYLTLIYNRDNSPKRYSIDRKVVIILFSIKHFSILEEEVGLFPLLIVMNRSVFHIV